MLIVQMCLPPTPGRPSAGGSGNSPAIVPPGNVPITVTADAAGTWYTTLSGLDAVKADTATWTPASTSGSAANDVVTIKPSFRAAKYVGSGNWSALA